MKTSHQKMGANHCFGYTLTEAMIATAIVGLVLSSAMAGFAYVMRADRLMNEQNELDMDARRLVEGLRSDLRLTSRDDIRLYPEEAPYTAIGFPMVLVGTPVEMGTDGGLLWETFVIYHFWGAGAEFEVRRTLFRNQTSIGRDQWDGQLAHVATTGTGSGAVNGGNSATRTLVRNLVEWEINTRSTQFDFYAPADQAGKRSRILGMAKIESGENTITFRSVGKNSAGTGASRHLSLDRLYARPSGRPLEGEWMTVQDYSGPQPTRVNINDNPIWSGNSFLRFPANANDQSVTLTFHNDSWEERNFFGQGVRLDKLDRFDTTRNSINTHALQLEGSNIIWSARDQTGHTGDPLPGDVLNDPPPYSAYIRGAGTDNDDGWIRFSGSNLWFVFNSAPAPEAPSAVITDIKLDHKSLDLDDVFVSGMTKSDAVGLYMDELETYFIEYKFLEDTTVQALGTNPIIYALDHIRAGHAPYGVYKQRINTQVDNPDYLSLTWNAFVPTLPDHETEQRAELVIKARAGFDDKLADAAEFDTISPFSQGTPFLSGSNVQLYAYMEPLVDTNRNTFSPELYDLTLKWAGEEKYVTIKGDFGFGPDHGIYEIEVNGKPLIQTATVDLTVYKDLPMRGGQSRRLTASANVQVSPRNSDLGLEPSEESP